MKRLRLTADKMEPALCRLRRQLVASTTVDPYALADWVRDNAEPLREKLKREGVSTPKHRDHIHELYAWVRIEFKERQVTA